MAEKKIKPRIIIKYTKDPKLKKALKECLEQDYKALLKLAKM